ncbi:hypothetical protein BaRGS_00020893 [Batillaria attramentaria]|uniref:Uncharacterized protein n=1 Tax=Batillaria attramentaria TaxID=370345 RepID=A0ABD0KL92_9CAEN
MTGSYSVAEHTGGRDRIRDQKTHPLCWSEESGCELPCHPSHRLRRPGPSDGGISICDARTLRLSDQPQASSLHQRGITLVNYRLLPRPVAASRAIRLTSSWMNAQGIEHREVLVH